MLIIDASAMLTLCFEDEDEEYSDKLFRYFESDTARAPHIWPMEICNALLTAINRQRLSKAEANHFYYLMSALPVEIEPSHAVLEGYATIFELAHACELSSYDAAYLALAMDTASQLATRDEKLSKAARKAGVEVF